MRCKNPVVDLHLKFLRNANDIHDMSSLLGSGNLGQSQGSSLLTGSSFFSTSDPDGVNESQRLDHECVQRIQETMQCFAPLVDKHARKRKILCLLASIAGTVLEMSGSLNSAQDSAGTSNAINQASRYLDTLLQAIDCQSFANEKDNHQLTFACQIEPHISWDSHDI